MLHVVDLYQPYHQLLQPRVSPRTVASLAATFFDQVYKFLQFTLLFYVIVQMVEVSAAIFTDLNLLSHQSVIVQSRNFNKTFINVTFICTFISFNWV